MRLIGAVLTGLLACGWATAATADCGMPPYEKPVIPDGGQADRDQMRSAVSEVKTFSDRDDQYLNCMDGRGAQVLPYMTKEQQQRWDEDLDTIHNDRVELQKSMNEQIRAYNTRVNEQS